MQFTSHGRMDRRNFLKLSGTAVGAAGLLVVAGCEGGGGDDGKSGSISANHGHTVSITDAQLAAGIAVALLLTIGDGHTHTLSLSAAEVQSLAAGGSVSKTSSTDAGHSHLVTF